MCIISCTFEIGKRAFSISEHPECVPEENFAKKVQNQKLKILRRALKGCSLFDLGLTEWSINPLRNPLTHRFIEPVVSRWTVKVIDRKSFVISHRQKHRNLEWIKCLMEQICPFLHYEKMLLFGLVEHIVSHCITDKSD